MSKRDNHLLIEDMLEAAVKIKQYTLQMNFDDFFKDEKTKDAVVRNFEIIGEAANRVTIDFQTGVQEIDWVKLAGFRNRLIHEYFGVDYGIVWNIVENELEQLIERLKSLV